MAGSASQRTKAKSYTGQSRDSVGAYLHSLGRSQLLTAADEVELAKTIECGAIAQAVLVGRVEPADDSFLTTATSDELERVAAEGQQAMKRFLESNLQLVVSIARKYVNQRIPLSDAIQEGNLGLMRAAEKFDYTQGYKFSTYATWWIRQAISRACAHQGRVVRLPVHVAEQLSQVERARRLLLQQLNRDPSTEEIAEQLEITPAQVADLLQLAREHVSLDAPLDDSGDRSLADLVAAKPGAGIEEVVIDQAERQRLEALVSRLDNRSADIVRRRFGLVDGSPAKLADIGRRWGITAERVRQIERKALADIRAAAGA
ncbi:MAG: sigma-70 family RNA polymerase sigma factor [Propionibacteriaceae bacterium]|nr:sigma-70 family RNA polymerase sigma factor [Propionibacteriaceae bacterium]